MKIKRLITVVVEIEATFDVEWDGEIAGVEVADAAGCTVDTHGAGVVDIGAEASRELAKAWLDDWGRDSVASEAEDQWREYAQTHEGFDAA